MGGADIGNAYLESKTREKGCIVAGPKFDSLKNHMLVITKTFHGLRTSGLFLHERLAQFIRHIGFQPCKMEP